MAAASAQQTQRRKERDKEALWVHFDAFSRPYHQRLLVLTLYYATREAWVRVEVGFAAKQPQGRGPRGEKRGLRLTWVERALRRHWEGFSGEPLGAILGPGRLARLTRQRLWVPWDTYMNAIRSPGVCMTVSMWGRSVLACDWFHVYVRMYVSPWVHVCVAVLGVWVWHFRIKKGMYG